MRVHILALAAPLSFLFASPSLAVQDSAPDLPKLLDVRIGEMQRGDVNNLWDAAQKAAIELGDEFGTQFDQLLDQRLQASSKDPAQGKQVLFLAAARVYGEDPSPELLLNSLLPLLDSPDGQVVQGTMNLLPLIGFASLEEEPRGAMTDKLLDFAENENQAADLRVLAAMTAHQVGLGRQVPRAQRVLSGFLTSSNPILRGEGALALAQLGIIRDMPGVQSELESLSKNPGPRGQLAQALLKQERLQTYFDNALTRAREDRADMVLSGNVGKDIQNLETLIDFVQTYHLEGPLFSREQLLDAAYNGLLGSLDQHSTYFSSDNFKRF
ncbi:MAG TPA: hypothetical protein P5218_10610, partial [Planctomycetota bacterium]|nr:hypothetical protein [Planctomycetota bacterium]